MSTQPKILATFSSFADLGAHDRATRSASAQAQNAEDVRKAGNLRRSRSLARSRQPGIGPRIAR
jgi:hypothetical protein